MSATFFGKVFWYTRRNNRQEANVFPTTKLNVLKRLTIIFGKSLGGGELGRAAAQEGLR